MEKEYIIKEFEDLLNLLRERPDYLEKLRMLILTKELLELPVKFEEFRREVNQRFEEIDRRFDEIDKRFKEVDKRFDEVNKRFEESDRKFEAFRSEVNQRFDEVDRRFEESDRKFEEFKKEVNQRFDEVDKRFEESDRKFETFRSEVNQRFEKLEKGQEEMKERQERMEEILKRHEISIQELKGWQLEHKVRTNICAYLGRYIRKCRIKDKSEIADELDEYVERNIISESERDEVLLLDILVIGISKRTNEEIYIAVEVSYKIGDYDVERAIKRMEILKRIYKKEVIAVIIGKEISDKTEMKLKNLNIDFILISD
jgi:chromosome segregation ATPase